MRVWWVDQTRWSWHAAVFKSRILGVCSLSVILLLKNKCNHSSRFRLETRCPTRVRHLRWGGINFETTEFANQMPGMAQSLDPVEFWLRFVSWQYFSGRVLQFSIGEFQQFSALWYAASVRFLFMIYNNCSCFSCGHSSVRTHITHSIVFHSVCYVHLINLSLSFLACIQPFSLISAPTIPVVRHYLLQACFQRYLACLFQQNNLFDRMLFVGVVEWKSVHGNFDFRSTIGCCGRSARLSPD